MFPHTARIYPITDVRLTGLSHAEQVARLIEGGATLIQLREKHLSPQQFYEQAKDALQVARLHGVRLFINDRVDLALALKADGVHLGQDDMPPEAARRLLGDKAIIGFSTHTADQALWAKSLPVDYVAVGPVFATSSKSDAEPVVGLEGVKRARAILDDIPLVAIGGITAETAKSVLDAGADSVALLSALLGSPREISQRTRRLISAL